MKDIARPNKQHTTQLQPQGIAGHSFLPAASSVLFNPKAVYVLSAPSPIQIRDDTNTNTMKDRIEPEEEWRITKIFSILNN